MAIYDRHLFISVPWSNIFIECEDISSVSPKKIIDQLAVKRILRFLLYSCKMIARFSRTAQRSKNVSSITL